MSTRMGFSLPKPHADRPSIEGIQPTVPLPVEQITVIRPRKYVAKAISEDPPIPKPSEDNYTISRLDSMTTEELKDLRWDHCREWKIFGAMGGDSWHPEKGWKTSLVMQGDEEVPMHDRLAAPGCPTTTATISWSGCFGSCLLLTFTGDRDRLLHDPRFHVSVFGVFLPSWKRRALANRPLRSISVAGSVGSAKNSPYSAKFRTLKRL